MHNKAGGDRILLEYEFDTLVNTVNRDNNQLDTLEDVFNNLGILKQDRGYAIKQLNLRAPPTGAGSRKKTKRRRVKSTHRRHRRHRKSTRRHRRKY